MLQWNPRLFSLLVAASRCSLVALVGGWLRRLLVHARAGKPDRELDGGAAASGCLPSLVPVCDARPRDGRVAAAVCVRARAARAATAARGAALLARLDARRALPGARSRASTSAASRSRIVFGVARASSSSAGRPACSSLRSRRRSCSCSSIGRRSASPTTRPSSRSAPPPAGADRRRSIGGEVRRACSRAVVARVRRPVLRSTWLLITRSSPSARAGRSSARSARTSRGTIVPFALMASAALMLVVLWQRSPLLSAALVGPLLAIALYQRSTYRALRAMRLALTDPLTGLGNHRHFHERLQRELRRGRGGRHAAHALPARHRRLQADQRPLRPPGGRPACSPSSPRGSARAARRSGSAATSSRVLLPGPRPARGARRRGARSSSGSAGSTLDHVGSVTVSAGVATLPGAGRRPRRADPARRQRALLGEGARQEPRARPTGPTWSSSPSSSGSPHGPDRAARYRAAASLAKAVDAARRLHRQPLGARRRPRRPARRAHGPRRGAGRADPARRAACTTSASSRSRRRSCASRARSPSRSGSCSSAIRRSASGCSRASASTRSPNGCCTTTSAGTGRGYPDGLSGTSIPLGARIIFVADAFDAMTSDRVYRSRLSAEAALEELERCAGTQFDPEIVSALAEELALTPASARPTRWPPSLRSR